MTPWPRRRCDPLQHVHPSQPISGPYPPPTRAARWAGRLLAVGIGLVLASLLVQHLGA